MGNKRDAIEARRDEIIKQYLDGGFTMSDIAAENDVSLSHMGNIMMEWREYGYLKGKDRSPLEQHRETICNAYRDGMSIRELARKFECQHPAMWRMLVKWGAHTPSKEGATVNMPMMTFDAASRNWADINRPVAITVSGTAQFMLVPIGGGE